MRDFVDVDAAVVGFLLVVTVPALREGELGRKRPLKGRAGASPERTTRGWSLKVGIMGCIENHLEIGKDGKSGSFWDRRNQDSRAEQGVAAMWSRTGPRWGRVDPWEDRGTRGLVLTA